MMPYKVNTSMDRSMRVDMRVDMRVENGFTVVSDNSICSSRGWYIFRTNCGGIFQVGN